ncbi:DUF5125 domain-containing protein [Dysgonomonas sp. ZJ279]|uniref:DUF5125 domain-containing protein n=1 Tax=Dysgonomonas sp. ZJ279 TaxID=2709796 RepID=UPI0013EA7339|nr:DUF5125 domain-containing protein [Dysgonomonas sp. ZJ279]
MKKYLYIILILSAIITFNSCSDDDDNPGNPVLNTKTQFGSAMFGDSLEFTIDVSDAEIPLSTVKAQLFFDEEKVSETVIRTKTNGEYSGKIYIPYNANTPNGTATLKLILQNINFTITEESYDLPLSRPDYPYLTLVTANGNYRMERIGLYQYKVTDNFPQKVNGYIKTPKVGTYGNELTFGWEDNTITLGSTNEIPFSNINAGEYSIILNTYNYEASPFLIYKVNGEIMQQVDDNNFKIDLNLTKEQKITFTGFSNINNWWIDPAFFNKDADGNLTFAAMSGNYRITANSSNQYFIIEALNGSNLATLGADGTGAIWIIGDGIGKPSVSSNVVGWNPDGALCFAPMGNKKYQVVLEAGKTVNADDINFKFFHQKGWGGEFSNTTLTTTSDIIFIGDGDNGRDSGNLGIVEGKSLESGAIYVFTVDLSQGNDQAVLTVVKK